jgi:hypothetical protein
MTIGQDDISNESQRWTKSCLFAARRWSPDLDALILADL